MSSFSRNIHRALASIVKWIIPYPLIIRTDAEAYSISKFMQFASGEVNPSERVLDAGAGSYPHKKYFSHAHYESTDIRDCLDETSKTMHDFVCDLSKIPKPDGSYDVIVNTQVLEHVEDPLKVLKEFYRILKPGGKLFLTAPQGWGIHEEPHHYFNFTKYGLESLFKKTGFQVKFIKPRGGMYWYLGKLIKTLPSHIMYQYSGFRAILLFPFYLIAIPVCEFIIPLLCFYLDKLDKKQHFTLGYACYCVKGG